MAFLQALTVFWGTKTQREQKANDWSSHTSLSPRTLERSWHLLLGQMFLIWENAKQYSRLDTAYQNSDPKIGKGEDESTVKSAEARCGGAGLLYQHLGGRSRRTSSVASLGLTVRPFFDQQGWEVIQW